MTTQSNVLAIKSALKSGKRPPPLNSDDIEPLLSASLKVQFSPAMLSPHVHFQLTSTPKSPFSTQSPKSSSGRKTRARVSSSRRDIEDDVQYAFETTKLPADVPTATFDGPLPSKFSSSESSSSDSDDSLSDVKPRQRSVRFSLPAPISPIPRARTQEEIDHALSFLPYPGSPYMRSPKMRPPRINTTLDGNTGKTLGADLPTNARKHAGAVPANGRKTRNIRRPAELLVPDLSDSDVPFFAPPGLMGRTKLSPVEESPLSTPSVTVECTSSDENTDSTTSTLTTAFWKSVSVQHSPSDEEANSPSPQRMPTDALQESVKLLSPAVPKPALLSPQLPSPYPILLYGKSSGTYWTPNVPRVRARMSPLDYGQFPFSPATTAAAARTFHAMTSPAPNEASFPTLATAAEFLEKDGTIAFPPNVELRE